MKKLNTKGFSLLEGLIVLVVISAVVGLGFYAKNRMDNRSSSAESLAVDPVPVYEVYYYYSGTKTVKHVDYVVGNDNLKRTVDSSKNTNVKNNRIAFLAFPNDNRAETAKLVHKLSLEGGNKRTDITESKEGAKTVIFTTNSVSKDQLVEGFGFDARSANIKLLEGQSNFYQHIEPISRLYKTVTEDGRRMYRYSTNNTVIENLKKDQKYKADSSSLYGPSVGRYCELQKTQKHGTLCKVKKYKLPDFNKFRKFIEESERRRLEELRRQQQAASSGSGSTGTGSATPSGGSGGGSRPQGGSNNSPPIPSPQGQGGIDRPIGQFVCDYPTTNGGCFSGHRVQ